MNWFRTQAALLAFAFAGVAFAQGRELPDFVKLVEDQGGAVVNISTTQAARRPTAALPGFGTSSCSISPLPVI